MRVVAAQFRGADFTPLGGCPLTRKSSKSRHLARRRRHSGNGQAHVELQAGDGAAGARCFSSFVFDSAFESAFESDSPAENVVAFCKSARGTNPTCAASLSLPSKTIPATSGA